MHGMNGEKCDTCKHHKWYDEYDDTCANNAKMHQKFGKYAEIIECSGFELDEDYA